jgi:hypothetical protein
MEDGVVIGDEDKDDSNDEGGDAERAVDHDINNK